MEAITKELTEPQFEFFNSDAEATAMVAGYGAGKTEVIVLLALYLLKKANGKDIAVYEPTYDLMKTIFYPRIEEILLLMGIRYKINKSEHIIYVQGYGRIICRSLSAPYRIVGYEVAYSLIDEFDTLIKKDALAAWNKIVARNRAKFNGGNQLFVGTTPEGFRATHQLFHKNKPENYRMIRASTYSNMHNLPEGYIDSLKSIYSEQLLQAYLDGLFVNLAHGNVYYAFSRNENDTNIIENGKEPLHIGCDFNVGNMHAIINVIRDKLPFAVGELTAMMDTPHMIKSIDELYHGREIYIYPDSSGGNRNTASASQTDIKLLRMAGYIVCVRASNPFIKDRVATMNSLFCNGKGERRYKVNTKKCPVFTEALEQQAYDDNNMPDKKSGLDHPVDAAGYFAHYLFAMNRPTFSVGNYIY